MYSNVHGHSAVIKSTGNLIQPRLRTHYTNSFQLALAITIPQSTFHTFAVQMTFHFGYFFSNRSIPLFQRGK
ncbi:hypothetical protein CRENPOLYSF1_440027 [Crenothrix polyspora]|uniref:Uncharacterized protein n=1 Tax=Crenothrix polyspora TaxID=360316 RepID=A0A1R4HCF6_9GAMM|nr:hypothetical protein CRENPOLYSF1_440027 [Crenothrix polyspora]